MPSMDDIIQARKIAKYMTDLIEQGKSPSEAREHACAEFGIRDSHARLIMADDAVLRYCREAGDAS